MRRFTLIFVKKFVEFLNLYDTLYQEMNYKLNPSVLTTTY